jgi:plasmid stabilization system protein ParE
LKRAIDNLEEEANYIAQENPQASHALITHIFASVEQLISYTNLGRAGRVFSTRGLVITGFPYIIPYRVKSNVIVVLRVFYTSRKWPKHL